RSLFSITSAFLPLLKRALLLCFHLLANSFALREITSRLFSSASELFAKNHPGWGYPLTFSLSFHLGTGGLLHLCFHVWNFFFYYRLQFAPYHVGGKSCAQQAAVGGSHLLFINFAAIRPQLAFDARAHHRAFIVLPGRFLQRRLDMPVRDAPRPQVPRNAKLTLLAPLGPLARKLLGVLRVIDLPTFLQTRHYHLHQQLVLASPLQLPLHFMHGECPPHQRPHRNVIQLRFGLKLARLSKHAGSIEAGRPGSKE